MKKVILIIAVAGLLGGAYGLYEYYRPIEATTELKADFTLSASDLYAAFDSDETAANARYIDKVVEVKGKVIDIKQDADAPSVILETSSAIGGIVCTLYQDQSSKLEALKQGDEITVKGKCTGYLMDVILKEAVIE